MSETEIKKGTNADIVCPACLKPQKPARMDTDICIDGLTRRSYLLWCTVCDRGFIVLQFKHGGRWRIEKYAAVKPMYIYDGPWQSIQTAMPDDAAEPLIQTGPGGDYQKTFTAEQITAVFEQYKKIQKALAAAGGQIVEMLRHLVDSIK